MRLDAITLGYAVPGGAFNASVHSAFPSAAYLNLEGRWELLTLVATSAADLPQGIRVDTPKGFTFADLQADERAICRDGVLRFGKSPTVIDLRNAVRWACDLLGCRLETTSPQVRGAWRFVWQALNRRQALAGTEIVATHLIHPHETGGSAMFHRFASGIAGLLGATACYDPSIRNVVTPLIGLGPGLTPAGDDLLVGYLAGLLCRTGEDTRRKGYVQDFGKELIELGSRTTDISRTYLYHAAFGQVSGRLAALAEAICRGLDSSRLQERANAAMDVGHTSGMDAVTGLLLGLAAWDRDLLP